MRGGLRARAGFGRLGVHPADEVSGSVVLRERCQPKRCFRQHAVDVFFAHGDGPAVASRHGDGLADGDLDLHVAPRPLGFLRQRLIWAEQLCRHGKRGWANVRFHFARESLGVHVGLRAHHRTEALAAKAGVHDYVESLQGDAEERPRSIIARGCTPASIARLTSFLWSRSRRGRSEAGVTRCRTMSCTLRSMRMISNGRAGSTGVSLAGNSKHGAPRISRASAWLRTRRAKTLASRELCSIVAITRRRRR